MLAGRARRARGPLAREVAYTTLRKQARTDSKHRATLPREPRPSRGEPQRPAERAGSLRLTRAGGAEGGPDGSNRRPGRRRARPRREAASRQSAKTQQTTLEAAYVARRRRSRQGRDAPGEDRHPGSAQGVQSTAASSRSPPWPDVTPAGPSTRGGEAPRARDRRDGHREVSQQRLKRGAPNGDTQRPAPHPCEKLEPDRGLAIATRVSSCARTEAASSVCESGAIRGSFLGLRNTPLPHHASAALRPS